MMIKVEDDDDDETTTTATETTHIHTRNRFKVGERKRKNAVSTTTTNRGTFVILFDLIFIQIHPKNKPESVEKEGETKQRKTLDRYKLCTEIHKLYKPKKKR